jgi:hypothetical protein
MARLAIQRDIWSEMKEPTEPQRRQKERRVIEPAAGESVAAEPEQAHEDRNGHHDREVGDDEEQDALQHGCVCLSPDAGMTAPCLQNRARPPADQGDPDRRGTRNFRGILVSNARP